MANNIDWEEVEKRLKAAMVEAYRASHRGKGLHWDNSPALVPTPAAAVRSLNLIQKEEINTVIIVVILLVAAFVLTFLAGLEPLGNWGAKVSLGWFGMALFILSFLVTLIQKT